MIRRGGLAAFVVATLVAAVGCAAGPSTDAERWWSHVEYLAQDSLGGRETGSAGYETAARYVATQFHRYGVEPAGAEPGEGGVADRYFQPVRFFYRRLDEPRCSLALVRDGQVIPIEIGRDAALSAGIALADSVEAPMVFVGWGLSVPEAGYDDLAGLDLRGKIAVYVRGGPSTLPGPLRAHAQTTDIRWAQLRKAGAVGVASFGLPHNAEASWERMMLNRHKPGMGLADSVFDETSGMQAYVRINPAVADRWFEGSGHTFAEIEALGDSERVLPRFPLAGRLRSRVRYEETYRMSPNVAGLIRGSDPKLRDEIVVVSAHLDHLGIGGAVQGDSIYNGAMDNASGVASLIEFARMAQASDTTFRRSVLLLAVTGEEKGLEGSRYFANRPTVPAKSIVANVNLDMFMPISPMKSVIAYGLKESDLGDWFVTAAGRQGVQVQDDPEPERRIFVRSDQYNFIRRGVPALSFKLGYDKGSAEERKYHDWMKERYHAPSDDLNQPVDRESAVAFTRLLFGFTREIANRDERPQWKPDSFFRRYAQPTPDASRASH